MKLLGSLRHSLGKQSTRQETSEKLQLAAQAYSENTALRMMVNAVPYVGGSLDVLTVSAPISETLPEKIR
jgi:hypothetical protein